MEKHELASVKISYELVPGTFYGEPAFWIYESHNGGLARPWGPYWSSEAAQAQIQAWTKVTNA